MSKELSKKLKPFTIFKVGKWNGETYTEKDIDQIVASYNPNDPPDIILGHSSDYKGQSLIPSFGKILGGLKKVGDEVVAFGVQVHDKMAEWISQELIVNRSIEMTQDNQLKAIGMLGAATPAVLMKDFDPQLAELAFSKPKKKLKVLTFAEDEADEVETEDEAPEVDDSAIDKVETMGLEDTLKDLSEFCGNFMKKVESALSEDIDYQTAKDRCQLAASDLNSEIWHAMDMYWTFKNKLDNIEEHSEMSDKKNWMKQFTDFVSTLLHKRKGTDVDAQKEKALNDEITRLKAQVLEFQKKEETAQAEQAKKDAEAAEAKVVADVKTFCDEKSKPNAKGEIFMTPAMREKDEPIMVALGKSNPDALKAFQEKYSVKVVPTGEMHEANGANGVLATEDVFKKAEKYVKENPKEFADVSADMRVNRAIYLSAIGKIKLS